MGNTNAWGQNFLISKAEIGDFLAFSNLNTLDNIIEIGVGEGALTIPMAKVAKRVVSIEIDFRLHKKLKSLSIKNLRAINKNFLGTDLSSLIKKNNINKIIAAIPYNITSPIIHKIIKESSPPLRGVYLIAQKEFVQKLIGKEKKNSYFTFLISRWAKIEEGKKIDKESFKPTPKVDSQSFSFKFFSYPNTPEEVVKWSKFLHHLFKTPRKKINKRFDPETLLHLGIDKNLRPQDLNPQEVLSLYKLKNQNKTDYNFLT